MRTAQVGCNTEFAAGSKADNASSDIDHAVARHTQPAVSTYPCRGRCSWIQIYVPLYYIRLRTTRLSRKTAFLENTGTTSAALFLYTNAYSRFEIHFEKNEFLHETNYFRKRFKEKYIQVQWNRQILE